MTHFCSMKGKELGSSLSLASQELGAANCVCSKYLQSIWKLKGPAWRNYRSNLPSIKTDYGSTWNTSLVKDNPISNMKNMCQTMDWVRDGLSPVQYNRVKRDTGRVAVALKQRFPRVRSGDRQTLLLLAEKRDGSNQGGVYFSDCK